jgi:hypothetical protein
MRFALFLLAACTTTQDPPAIDAAPAHVDAGGAATDAGPDPTADAGAAGCTSPMRGYVEIAHEPGEEAGRQDNAVALFWDARDACEPEIVGACSYLPCAAPAAARMVAGTVELYGSLGEHSLRHDAPQGIYYVVSDFEAAWTPGETVAARASGAAFPAFDLGVTIPPLLELTTPPPAEITGAFEVAWTPASGPDVLVYLISESGPSITCSFPNTAGEGEIPLEALTRLGAVRANVAVVVENEREDCSPSHRVAVAAAYRPFDEWLEIRLPE